MYRATGRGESSSRQQPPTQRSPASPRQQAEDFDRHHFISAEAYRWYKKSFNSRNIVMERAIKFTAPEYEHFEDELERRQWLKLTANPSPARSHLVESSMPTSATPQATEYILGASSGF